MKIHQLGILSLFLTTLSACVTQQLVDENNKQIVRQEATGEQLALTRISLALSYLKIGDVTQAKLNLEKAKNFAPRMVSVHTGFAHFYESVGETDLAIDSYEKALVLDDNNPDTLNNYGVFLCKQGQLAEAQKQILKAIAVPTYLRVAESYENLGLCHLASDNFKEAEFFIDKAIAHSSQRASSVLQMAIIQYAKGDYSQANRLVKHHDTVNRRYSPRSLALSYRLERKFNARDKAKGYANILVSTFPNSQEAKEYITSSLTNSEGDKLAKRYQVYKQKNKPKRRLKFSPNKEPVVVIQASGPLRAKPKSVIETKKVIATPLTAVIASAPKVTNRVITPVKVARDTQAVITPSPKVADRVIAPVKVVRNTQAVISPSPKVADRVVTPVKVTRNIQPIIEPAPKLSERVVRSPKVKRQLQQVIATGSDVPEQVVVSSKTTNTKQVIKDKVKVKVPQEALEDKIETYTRGKFRVAVEMIDNLTAKEFVTEIDGIEVLDIQSVIKAPKLSVENTLKKATREELLDANIPTHIMSKGDNLFRVALGNEVTITSLLLWNNLDLEKASSIKEGDVIYLADPLQVKK